MSAHLEFECQFCGSPAVSLPSSLYASATVCCGACQAPIGTWEEYKKRVSTEVLRSGAMTCADPIAIGNPNPRPGSKPAEGPGG